MAIGIFLSVRANRNDTYLSLFSSLLVVLLVRFSHSLVVLCLAFYEVTTNRANIEKRARPVKSRVNKARKITTESLNTYTKQYRFLYFCLVLLFSTIYGRSIIFLTRIRIVINLSMMID